MRTTPFSAPANEGAMPSGFMGASSDTVGRRADEASQESRARKVIAWMLIVMLSGTLMTAGLIWPYAQWVVLIVVWIAIPFTGRLTLLEGMPKSAKRYLLWLIVLVPWGVAVSPIVPIYAGARSLALSLTAFCMVWVIGSSRASWRYLGTLAPFGILLNVFVTLVTMNNHALRAWFLLHHALGESKTEQFRYSGLWGNGNEGSCQILILIALSIWGPRWAATLGFLSGAVMIFCTASRTGTYIFILVFAAYVYYFLRNSKWFRTAAFVGLLLGGLVLLQDVLPNVSQSQLTSQTSADTGVAIGRVLDPLESQTDQSRTRLANFRVWQPYIEKVPWYGYGLNSEAGSATTNADAATTTDMPLIGTHNVYLGVLVDNGFFGLLGFVVVLIGGLITLFRSRIHPYDKLPAISIWITLLIFGAFAHSLHILPYGTILFAICFLSPALPALIERQVGEEEADPNLVDQSHIPGILRARGVGPDGKIPVMLGGFRAPGRGSTLADVTSANPQQKQEGGFRRPGRSKKEAT